MKKLLALSLLSVAAAGLQAAKNNRGDRRKLVEAIEAHDLIKVKGLIRKIEKTDISLEEKKSIFDSVQETASEAKQHAHSRLYKNWRDAWKTVLGSYFFYRAISGFVFAKTAAKNSVKAQRDLIQSIKDEGRYVPWPYSIKENYSDEQWNDEEKAFVSATRYFTSPINMVIGGALAYWGMSCKNQKAVIAKAEEIDLFINNKHDDIENPDGDDDEDF